jgi:hypothetical protein
VITRDRTMGNSRCAITRVERISSGRERRNRSAQAAPGSNQ